MARAPSTSRRTGRIIPALTKSEKATPKIVASAVRTAAPIMSSRCLCKVVAVLA